jgi:hypothetical protein
MMRPVTRTKFSKPIETFFYPVGDDVAQIFKDWTQYLIKEKYFGPIDPVFPKTLVRPDDQCTFVIDGLSREHWADAGPVRAIFKAAYARVELPYFKPHSVRSTLTQHAYTLKLSPEQLKAWSQNMGHDSVLTTIASYGPISVERQQELISGLGKPGLAAAEFSTEIAEKVVALLKR